MPLLAFWESNPEIISRMRLEQVVTSAGDGALRDNTECSSELRGYLSRISTERIAGYINECLSAPFNGSGKVLQDLVNELGRRLEYNVTNGRYQGTTNRIGFDGICCAPDGHWLVIEVKTTDAYRISLDSIAGYRSSLLRAGTISEPSSVLIVVGRDDTGELEAQIRGSRHAWDVRLISTDALIKLVRLKESTDDPATVERIRSLLVPFESTKLDEIIDIMFVTARDVEQATEEEIGSAGGDEGADAREDGELRQLHSIDALAINAKRDQIVDALGRRTGAPLLKRSRATFWDANHQTRIVCTVSKRYEATERYWYAYHPRWDSFLDGGTSSFVVLGCADLNVAFAIPLQILREQLGNLYTTVRENGQMYWHIKIIEQETGRYGLQLPRTGGRMPLDSFMLPLDDATRAV